MKILGCNEQPDEKINLVNQNKICEEELLRRLDALAVSGWLSEARWLSIARTHFEQGFMALNRAILRPDRVSTEKD